MASNNVFIVEAIERRKKILNKVSKKIIICGGTGCIANRAMKVYKKFCDALKAESLNVEVSLKSESSSNESVIYVSKNGCQGFCQMGPLISIEPDNVVYVKVRPEDVDEIVEKTIKKNKIIERLLYIDPIKNQREKWYDEINFYKKQQRLSLRRCGRINPEDIDEYIYDGGYEAAIKALFDMSDKDICDEILRSGLRGRGGGGFSTGRKWELTRIKKADKKYIVCNGDEGDPGAFMDRSIMEGDPHAVIEGMIIAGKAIGAEEGYIYVRMEYPLAVERLKIAIDQARKYGFLGKNIFNSGYNFDIIVMEGAGAFVCGEETALLASIEGKRGMPMPKPPFPAEKGLFGKPTVINNVETLATVPVIIKEGWEKFKSIGTPTSPGTKTFALTGQVANSGLIETPMGIKLKDIIFEIGGGVTDKNGEINNQKFKAAQIGGPSGGCLTKEHLDMPLDFDSLKSIGAMIGSGGLVVINDDTCIVKVARFFMQFTQNESCGKCVLCREGTKQMPALLDDLIEGRGDEKTIELLETLGKAIQKGSLCGLGKTAPNPVLSTIKFFREEYLAHAIKKECPSKECKALLKPKIVAKLCKGCGLCLRYCPVGAIKGNKKEPHVINEELCIKCGACIEACKLNAITVG